MEGKHPRLKVEVKCADGNLNTEYENQSTQTPCAEPGISFSKVKQLSLKNVPYLFKAGTVKQADTGVAREWLCKHARCQETDS
jgi:hypothetical protein